MVAKAKTCGQGERLETTTNTCAECQLGSTFQSAARHQETACNPVQPPCTGDEHQPADGAPTLKSDRLCEAKDACTATQYTVRNDAGQQRVCAGVSVCKAGHYVTADNTADSDRTCAKCASGSFSTSDNAPSCASHRSGLTQTKRAFLGVTGLAAPAESPRAHAHGPSVGAAKRTKLA